ncbi:proline-rich protein 2-like [Cricetulus griseus]|uniref:Proline-rich protein 2-like n=1 Tax=Cricetulus griseus TaxID=10029 RepID=A0A9J7KBQ6_CRIGR|nr:proline-rich protein 2-like [Cricetulus griseus]
MSPGHRFPLRKQKCKRRNHLLSDSSAYDLLPTKPLEAAKELRTRKKEFLENQGAWERRQQVKPGPEGPLTPRQLPPKPGSRGTGSHSAASPRERPRPAPRPDPGFEHPIVGRLHPAAAAQPSPRPGGSPQPRACSARSPMLTRSPARPLAPPPAARRRRRVPSHPGSRPRPAAPLTRAGAGLASGRPRRARGSRAGRAGKEGTRPAPLGASASRRGRTEQSREHNSPRLARPLARTPARTLAHPPQRAPASQPARPLARSLARPPFLLSLRARARSGAPSARARARRAVLPPFRPRGPAPRPSRGRGRPAPRARPPARARPSGRAGQWQRSPVT